MEYKIVMSESANLDFDKILEYILKQHPYAYERSDEPYFREKGYRKCVVESFIMFYRMIEEKKEVFILRIFYERQNYFKYLKKMVI